MSAMPADRAQRRLLRALAPTIEPFTLMAARSTGWSSATYQGARHRLAVRLEGSDADLRAIGLAARLPDANLSHPGGFVADLLAVADTDANGAPVLGIEVLTIEEA